MIDPGPDLARAPRRARSSDRRAAGSSPSCARTPTAITVRRPRPLAERTGAPIIGCAPLALETVGPRADASFDGDYSPDRVLDDGESDRGRRRADRRGRDAGPHVQPSLLRCMATHLFTGDHVMGWSTTVVVPPDGDMAAYMASLDKLRQRGDRVYYPAHGPAVTNPQQYVRHLMGHRMQREKQILRLVGEQAAAHSRHRRQRLSGARPAAASRRPAARCSRIFWTFERRGLVEQQGDAMDNRLKTLLALAADRRRADARRCCIGVGTGHRRPHVRRSESEDNRDREPGVDARAEPAHRSSRRATYRW